MSPITIEIFQTGMEKGILDLILSIQNDEFGIPITKEQQPDLMNIKEFYQVNNGNFWCALMNDRVVGTIALIDIGNQKLVLRKMFVHSDHRGTGAAQQLLNTVLNWAKEKGSKEIYLGTTEKFLAAHRFYEKNNFVAVPINQLPENFPVMKVDTKFYMKKI